MSMFMTSLKSKQKLSHDNYLTLSLTFSSCIDMKASGDRLLCPPDSACILAVSAVPAVLLDIPVSWVKDDFSDLVSVGLFLPLKMFKPSVSYICMK